MSVDLVIKPKPKDLGEFTVRRVLPSPGHRKVGPFVFFDHMGPAEFPPGKGIAVRPHPHIGLATITYLFEGEIVHRDSLGYVQPIQAGAVNLMTAGRGIVHYPAADLPGFELDGVEVRVIIGEAHGFESPAHVKALDDSHVLLIGGAARSDRTVWWNFVSSSKERLEKAKDDWRNKRFDAVPGETEFIPLPK